jgi:hypothetical protein
MISIHPEAIPIDGMPISIDILVLSIDKIIL